MLLSAAVMIGALRFNSSISSKVGFLERKCVRCMPGLTDNSVVWFVPKLL